MAELNERVAHIEGWIAGVDPRLDRIEVRLDRVDARLDHLATRIDEQGKTLLDQIGENRRRIDALDVKFDRKFDRMTWLIMATLLTSVAQLLLR